MLPSFARYVRVVKSVEAFTSFDYIYIDWLVVLNLALRGVTIDTRWLGIVREKMLAACSAPRLSLLSGSWRWWWWEDK